jgi:hypothetical protein
MRFPRRSLRDLIPSLLAALRDREDGRHRRRIAEIEIAGRQCFGDRPTSRHRDFFELQVFGLQVAHLLGDDQRRKGDAGQIAKTNLGRLGGVLRPRAMRVQENARTEREHKSETMSGHVALSLWLLL